MSHLIENQLAEIKAIITQQTFEKKEILTLSEAALHIGISKSYLYKLTSARKIPFYRPEVKLIFFKKSELEDWILNNRQDPYNEPKHTHTSNRSK